MRDMDLSTAMRFVLARAQAEAASLRTKIYPEHLFVGILKLAELSADKDFAAAPQKSEIQADIDAVRSRLAQAKIDSGETRLILRRSLKLLTPSGNPEAAVSELLTKAAKASKAAGAGDGDGKIRPCDILVVLLKEPTALLKTVLFPQEAGAGQGAGAGAGAGAGKAGRGAAAPKAGRAGKEVTDLLERIEAMRCELLDRVRGQDHAVHGFAEGVFHGEMLAASDRRRRQPKAVFVFAGPPGVGKTFLAEEGAKCLKLPVKRLEMSGYSTHYAHTNLIGMFPGYKDAKPGNLTKFVKENPSCILIFDEIEKAHLNTIQLFLQILDAGKLRDDFTEEDVSFRDTLIIFTTNAGRQLYESSGNAANLDRQTILDAIGSEKGSRSGGELFPPAICSRMATGYPVMFNRLAAHDLEAIAAIELRRLGDLFQKQYGPAVEPDDLLPSLLLFAEGGLVDARALKAQTEIFFKNEMFKLFRLWEHKDLATALARLTSIRFAAETDGGDADVQALFKNPDHSEFLYYGDTGFTDALRKGLPDYVLWDAATAEMALKLAAEKDVLFAIIDIAADYAPDTGETVNQFARMPAGASVFRDANKVFKALRQRLPELPVFFLDSEALLLDDNVMSDWIRQGARGKITKPRSDCGDFGVFADELGRIAGHLYLQEKAAALAAEAKLLSFETVPRLSESQEEISIRLRNFSLRRAVRSGDGSVLDEAEKPQTRFSDVVGAKTAKDELMFFVDFLKNPKKFLAQGLTPPKGVLLYGPPGTGKTLLAKAMAGESGVAYIPTVGSSFVTKWQGSGPEAVRDLFSRARRYAPAVVFIDELDAIGRAREGGHVGHGEEMALNALLAEMDGLAVDPNRPVFVLAATNFEVEEGKGGMGVIDPALARRFDRKILVDLPEQADRLAYLELMLKKRGGNTVTPDMIKRLANRSTGLSLSALNSVLEFAGRMAVQRNCPLNDAILDEAYEITIHGEEKAWGRESLERVARHEAGHALLCHLAGATPAYLTIVARSGHGGYMEHDHEEQTPLKTKKDLLARIRTALGGRAAEMVYYGEEDGLSSGASSDLRNATKIAYSMICEYGMDSQVGLIAQSPKELLDTPLAGKIMERVSLLLNEALSQTVASIQSGRGKIDSLVEKLLEKNKLTKEEIAAIFAEEAKEA
jgi:ATP-dependent metalloprotease FtsH